MTLPWSWWDSVHQECKSKDPWGHPQETEEQWSKLECDWKSCASNNAVSLQQILVSSGQRSTKV